jgi:hypothetical protein
LKGRDARFPAKAIDVRGQPGIPFAREQRMDTRLFKETRRQIERANQSGIDFLIAELNVGLTFLQTADVTGFPTTRERDLEKALLVYRTVVRLLPRVNLSAGDQAEIDGKLGELRAKLEQAGYSVNA